jgi:hypothetical protein
MIQLRALQPEEAFKYWEYNMTKNVQLQIIKLERKKYEKEQLWQMEIQV